MTEERTENISRLFIYSANPELGTDMASNTKETRFKRKLRKKNAGRARKYALEYHGTTPKFEVHSADAVANAAKLAAAKA